MAAPSKYNTQKVEEICKYVREGLGHEDAATIAGISAATFYAWKKSKLEFSEALKEADSHFKRFNLAIIEKAALRSWQAAAWLLERKYPSSYALTNKLQHTGKDGGPMIRANVSAAPDPELLKILEGLPKGALVKLAEKL